MEGRVHAVLEDLEGVRRVTVVRPSGHKGRPRVSTQLEESSAELKALLEKEPWQAREAREAYRRRTREFFLGFLVPAIAFYSSMESDIALLNCAKVGIAALRYKSEHGSLPAKLEDLLPNYIKQLPLDPFTGGPLQYREGRVYSVGHNGKDEAGLSEEKKDDVGFRLK